MQLKYKNALIAIVTALAIAPMGIFVDQQLVTLSDINLVNKFRQHMALA